MLSNQRPGEPPHVQGLDALLIERSPDFLVILDAEMRVVRASAGLRSAVPVVAPGEDFLRSLDEPSQDRLRQSLSLPRSRVLARPRAGPSRPRAPDQHGV